MSNIHTVKLLLLLLCMFSMISNVWSVQIAKFQNREPKFQNFQIVENGTEVAENSNEYNKTNSTAPKSVVADDEENAMNLDSNANVMNNVENENDDADESDGLSAVFAVVVCWVALSSAVQVVAEAREKWNNARYGAVRCRRSAQLESVLKRKTGALLLAPLYCDRRVSSSCNELVLGLAHEFTCVEQYVASRGIAQACTVVFARDLNTITADELARDRSFSRLTIVKGLDGTACHILGSEGFFTSPGASQLIHEFHGDTVAVLVEQRFLKGSTHTISSVEPWKRSKEWPWQAELWRLRMHAKLRPIDMSGVLTKFSTVPGNAARSATAHIYDTIFPKEHKMR